MQQVQQLAVRLLLSALFCMHSTQQKGYLVRRQCQCKPFWWQIGCMSVTHRICWCTCCCELFKGTLGMQQLPDQLGCTVWPSAEDSGVSQADHKAINAQPEPQQYKPAAWHDTNLQRPRVGTQPEGCLEETNDFSCRAQHLDIQGGSTIVVQLRLVQRDVCKEEDWISLRQDRLIHRLL